MARSVRLIAGLVLVLGAAIPASASAAECEGRCRDAAGNVATVSAGACDPAGERCRAGCDSTASPLPRPYAECVSQTTGLVVPRAQVVQPGGKRTRSGEAGGSRRTSRSD
jgi:hypothetical protein